MTATPDQKPYHVCLKARDQSSLHPLNGDPMDFTVTTRYEVCGLFDIDDDERVLGGVTTQHVKLGEALNEHVSWLDVVDSQNQDLYDIYHLMFDESQCLREDFVDIMGDTIGHGILYIPSDEVLDAQWGPTVVRTLAQHSGCPVVVVGVTGLIAPQDAGAMTKAIERSAKLSAMGFTRYATSPFFFLNMDYLLPQLPAHLELNEPEEVV